MTPAETRPPKLSIGLPFYNSAKTLLDAVRSVFAQTFCDWELILVDDGSRDGSLDVVRRIADPRVRVISDGINQGLCVRLNQIAALARGELLARMDSDDLMHPLRLARQVEFLDCHPRVDLLDTATFTIDENNRPLGIRGDHPLNSDPGVALTGCLLVHPTVTGRTRWFRANPYDAGFVRAEDQELWNRTCRNSVFDRLQDPLFFYRESMAGNLHNYLSSARTVRKIMRVYGPAAVGRLRTATLIAQSHLKSWTYRVLTKLGWQDRLIKKRIRPLGSVETDAARAALRTVLDTPVPGF